MTSAMSTGNDPSGQLAAYLDWLTVQGLSRYYVNRVREFLARYVASAPVVTPQTALAFLARFNERKPNTRARYATYLRGFLAYLELPFNIRVKVPKQLPPFVLAEDIDRLRACISAKRTHKASEFRDLVLLDTPAKTGLRRSELAHLKVGDIDFSASRLKVVGGKGARDQVIPLLPSLRDDLAKLCHEKQPLDTVFDLGSRSLGMKFSTWAKKAGVKLSSSFSMTY